MTLEERIARVRELIERRDEIDEELDTLLSDEKHGPVGDRRFKNHGKDVDRFERNTGIILPKEHIERKPRTCGGCGETGHRKDNCPVDAPAPQKSAGSPRISKLSVVNYQRVMGEKDNGRSTFGTAALLRVPESEVKKAYESPSWIAYKES